MNLEMTIFNVAGCVNDGSGILFGFLRPKRYSGQRVKTPITSFYLSLMPSINRTQVINNLAVNKTIMNRQSKISILPNLMSQLSNL